MRILHLVHQYRPDHVGGTELYTQTLAQAQVRQGHEVAILTPAATDAHWPQPHQEEGVRVYRIPIGQRSATAVFRSNFHHPRLTDGYRQVQQAEQPDLVHLQHLMGLPWNLAGSISAPLIVTLHDYWYLCANAQLLTNYSNQVCGGPKGWLNCARCALARAGYPQALPLTPGLVPLFAYRHWRLRQVLQKARALIAPSRFTAEIYRQMGILPEKITVIPHGIQLPERLPPRQAGNGLHIAYIGGLSWQKGVHVLVAAVNQLPHAGVRLSIWGDTTTFPDYVAQLRQQATHPGIALHGRLPHHLLWQALSTVDLLVVPTLWYETSSLIIQEAQAAGVPVLASRIGAVQERLRDGVDGFFFPAGDERALLSLLRRFLAQPELVEELRQQIRPVKTIAEHLAQVTAVYYKALSGSP